MAVSSNLLTYIGPQNHPQKTTFVSNFLPQDGPEELLIEAVLPEDHGELIRLWQRSGINYGDVANNEDFQRFLSRTPNVSSLCRVVVKDCARSIDEAGSHICGVALSGDDGLYGYIYHVAVLPEMRRRHIGQMLVERTCSELAKRGVTQSRLFVRSSNNIGAAFWSSLGWSQKSDAYCLAKNIG